MKSVLISFLFFLFIFKCSSQTIDYIRTEQVGEQVNIFYKVSNFSKKRPFRVTLNADLNEGSRIDLKSLTGDIGEVVNIGREECMITWDVLRDVDELRSADFHIRIEQLPRGRVFGNIGSFFVDLLMQ